MKAKLFVLFVLLFSSLVTVGQSDEVIAPHINEKEVKIVIRTEEKLEDHYVALDNMTIKVNADTSKVYYMHYGDRIISSVTIPYPVFDKFINYEQSLKEYTCLSEPCLNSVLIEIGTTSKRYPIDILHVESLSSLMLEFEN